MTAEDQERQSETKICPFCAEEIKFNARKCKHCGSMLGSNVPSDRTVENTESSALVGQTYEKVPRVAQQTSGSFLSPQLSAEAAKEHARKAKEKSVFWIASTMIGAVLYILLMGCVCSTCVCVLG